MQYTAVKNNIWFLVIVFLLIFCSFYAQDKWKQARQNGDGMGYYLYLPALFIYNDIGEYKSTFTVLKKYQPTQQDPRDDPYGFRESPTGKVVNKYPIGGAILQAPFFFIAHVYASISGSYAADGFSRPYQAILFFSTVFYVVIGLWLLYKMLKIHFPDRESKLTVFLIALGTNLLYFTAFSNAMAHGYQFFVVSLLIYSTYRFYEKPGILWACMLGITMAMIGMLRSQDLVFGLIPALWGIQSGNDFIKRMKFVGKYYPLIILALATMVMCLLPQFSYLKWISGEWFYYTYVGETFNWSKPRIFSGLFHFHNGWFIWTPLMLFAIAGMFVWQKGKMPVWWLPLVIILPIHIYVAYSWWCWQYIAGLGSRPMVDLYPLLAFPLAAMLVWLFRQNKAALWSGLTVVMLFSLLNVKFTFQQYHGHVFSEYTFGPYFMYMLPRWAPDEKAIKTMAAFTIQPSESKLNKVSTLVSEDFEDTDKYAQIDSAQAFSGQFSLALNREVNDLVTFSGKDISAKKGDYFYLDFNAYLSSTNRIWDLYRKETFILVYKKSPKSDPIWVVLWPSLLIGNTENSIWHLGKTDYWENVSVFSKIPITFTEESTLQIIGVNPPGQLWYLDDLTIEHWANR